MRKFKDLIEARGDTEVFTLGRFNPPTTGHEKLIKKMDSVAKQNNASMSVFPTHSNDPAKNPLPHGLKVAYMKKMYKKYAKNIKISKARNVFEVAKVLFDKGHKSIIMVVGSDRVAEFTKLLEKYDGVESTHGFYEFDNIQVISAGERDPDAEGVSGMSASKMRAAAADGDKDSFLQGVPSSFKDGDKLYSDVRKGMDIREERDMGDMSDFEQVRDAYLTGKIWNVGDVVESKGITGEIVRKGTNYLSFVSEDSKVHKAWLHDIQVDEARMSALDKLRKFDKSRVASGKPAIFKDKKGQEFVRMSKQGQRTIMNVPADEVDNFIEKGYKIIEGTELDERNYAKEYVNYQGTPEQIARRSSRNKARRVMGDKTKIGMDVGHKDNNPMNNDPTNLRNEDPSLNRREPRLREASDHRKDYETFVKMYAQLNKAMDDASVKLKKFPKGQMGMTSDKVKSSPAYKKAKADYEKATNLTKRFLKGVPKDFMKKNALSRRKEEVDLDEMSWFMKAKAKLDQMSHPKDFEKMTKKYVDDLVNPKLKNKTHSYIADKIARNYEGHTGRTLIQYINKLVDDGKLPKEIKAEFQIETFKDFVDQINEVKQDKDIDDKKGTQPAKYYDGDMAKSTKDKRDAHFKKKKSGPAPGDSAKTKPSKHTKKFKQMFGEKKMDCPPATQDLAINTKNRDHATKKYNYGPLNVDEPADYWEKIAKHWKTSVEAAKKSLCENCVAFDVSPRMEDCLPGATSDDDGELGYCWMHHFKCHSARACHTWAKGGPIDKDKESYNWQERAFGKEEVLSKNADQGDYIDDFVDSDAPQFKGKSKKKRKEMAIAAYLSKNESLIDKAIHSLNEDGHTDVASMKNKVKVAMSALQKMQGELSKLGDEDSLPTWWTNKVATAVSRLDDMSDYLDTQVEGVELDEKITGLVNKAEKSGMPYSILKKVYDRGMAAYKTGHRPGATPQQWAFARVNSFTTKSAGTWGKADKDLAKQVEQIEEACWDDYKQVGMKKKSGKMVPNCVPKNEEPRIPRKKGQPAGSDKHSDLYTDENPVGTIQGLGFKDVDTAKSSVKKIIGSGKTHAHKIQAAIAMEQRAKEMGKTAEASVYRTYIDKMKKKTKEMQEDIKSFNKWGEITEVDDKSGKELNNPTKGDIKKYKVYVKNDKGNVVKVEFGDPNMEIKRDDPARRKAFRARHNCDQKKDKTTAGYWSCKFWSGKSVTDLMKG